jgi:hypothetical protein
MKVLKATIEEKQKLEGFYLNGHFLGFVEDKHGNWVVGSNVLENKNFTEIHFELLKLPLIDFVPRETEI